jgi:hypothetical protein
MVVAARTDDGFAYRYWTDGDRVVGGEGWNHWANVPNDRANPPYDWRGFGFMDDSTPPGWPLIGWIDEANHARINGFFEYSDAGANLAVGQPWWQFPEPGFIALDGWQKDFWPRVGQAWADAQGQLRLNICGQRSHAPHGNLRELFWDAGEWHWADLNDGPAGEKLGPSSLVFPDQQQGYLFAVTLDAADVRLFVRRGDGDWTWQDFPSLAEFGVADLSAPVALNNGNDIHVFTSGRWAGDNAYHLFRAQRLNGEWSDWRDCGLAPDEPIIAGERSNVVRSTRFLSGGRFSMTSGCVWGDARGLRIDLFGHSDVAYLPFLSAGSGSLVHYAYHGGQWSWQATTRPPVLLDVPGGKLGVPFRTTSSAAYTSFAPVQRHRVSVVGFTQPPVFDNDGNQLGDGGGDVWEYAFDTSIHARGRPPQFIWHEL